MKLNFKVERKDVIIFIIFCVFLLYLVCIAILNLNAFSTAGTFHGLNPFPAFGPNFIVSTLVFYSLTLVAVFLSVKSYFFEREKGIGFSKPTKNPDGWSKWAKDDDIIKQGGIEKISLSSDHYNAAGIPLMLGTKQAYVDNGESHSLIIGSTGSGKTECVILPLARILAKAGESMIFTDPKGEIYKKTAGILKENGYKIILLNFRDPLHGNCWNPLRLPYQYYKAGDVDKASELLEDLGSNIIIDPNNKSQDPFWENSAASYFAGLALGLFEDGNEEEVNLNSINLMSTQGEERFNGKDYLREYFGMKGDLHPAAVSASNVINAPNDTKGGITSVFRQKIRMFSSRVALSEMLSHSDFDMADIGKEKTAVFLMIHDEKKTYHALTTIFVKQVYESLIDVAFKEENGKLRVRTNFLLDEFANMPALKDVDAMITASRSRNIRFNFIIQNFSQLNQVYGADMAETIKGNCTNLHFLATTELKALEEISKLCGDAKPPKPKEGQPQEPVRPLVSVSDLQNFKKFEFLINRLRTNPFKTKFTPDYELNKINAWGKNYDEGVFPTRDAYEVKSFDIKEFVKSRKKDEINDMMNSGNMQNIPGGFSPFGNFGKEQKNENGQLNIDEFIKKIDKEIAELEKKEKKEKNVNILNNNSKEINKPIIEKKEINLETKTNSDIPDELKEEKVEEKKSNEKETLDKPKINIDADSIIVDENVTDDQFFDDFFGEEE